MSDYRSMTTAQRNDHLRCIDQQYKNKRLPKRVRMEWEAIMQAQHEANLVLRAAQQ